MRANIYSAFATLAMGLEILRKENVAVNTLLGHGGIFKTPGVAQRYLAAAAGAPVTCMETAGEGGSYGMALLAAYRLHRADGETLAAYLNHCVFADAQSTTLSPTPPSSPGLPPFDPIPNRTESRARRCKIRACMRRLPGNASQRRKGRNNSCS